MRELSKNYLNDPLYSFEKMKFIIISQDQIFQSVSLTNAAIAALRGAINNEKPVDDQPGSVRYYLNDEFYSSLVCPWLSSNPFQNLCKHLFKERDIYIMYLRSRNPNHLEGEQSFHSDWDPDCPGERLEIFIALDDIRCDNGPIEIKTSSHVESFTINCYAGSLIVIDSTLLHRGTMNLSGASRQVVGGQVGTNPRVGEEPLCRFQPSSH